LTEPIRCTPNHITWSVVDRDFVEAHKLQPGNLVLCDDGVRELVRVEKLAEPIRVYNLEVQGQHVYQVSSLGMLVHNVSPNPLIGELDDLAQANASRRQVLDNLRRVKDELMGSGELDRMADVQRQMESAQGMIDHATRRIDDILRLLGY